MKRILFNKRFFVGVMGLLLMLSQIAMASMAPAQVIPAGVFHIQLSNLDADTYNIELNTSPSYYNPPLPSSISSYHTFYTTYAVPTGASKQGGVQEFAGPTMVYTSTSDPNRKCTFGFTGDSTTGCHVYVESPPPQLLKNPTTPTLCVGSVQYNASTNPESCNVYFTIN